MAGSCSAKPTCIPVSSVLAAAGRWPSPWFYRSYLRHHESCVSGSHGLDGVGEWGSVLPGAVAAMPQEQGADTSSGPKQGVQSYVPYTAVPDISHHHGC